MNYFSKYLKYKNKYLNLQNQYGGANELIIASKEGNIDKVKSLLLEGGINSIDEKDSNGQTALLVAINKARLEIVKFLLDKGADIFIKDNYNTTSLMLSINKKNIYNNTNIIHILLEKGIDKLINDTNSDNMTALKIAIELNNKDIIKLLLEKGADQNIIISTGQTPLMWAIELGYEDIIEILFNKGADKLINTPNSDGQTPLLVAINKGHVKIVEFLLNKGADIFLKNNNGDTSLILASKLGYENIVKILLNKVDNLLLNKLINEQDSTGKTALTHVIIINDEVKTKSLNYTFYNMRRVNRIMRMNDSTTEIYNSHRNIINILLDKRANPNIKDNLDKSSYNYIFEMYNIYLIKQKYIVCHGTTQPFYIYTDYNRNCDCRGRDILNLNDKLNWEYNEIIDKYYDNIINKMIDYNQIIIASKNYNWKKVASLLLEDNYKSINEKDIQHGWTILQWAVYYNDIDTVKYLLQNGADPNRQNNDGNTALILAIKNNNILKDLKSDTSLPNNMTTNFNGIVKKDDTVFTLKAKENNLAIIENLLVNNANPTNSANPANPANPDIKNNDGNTALILAIEKKYENIAKCLILNKANLEIKNNNSNTALILAVQTNYTNIITDLIINKANPDVKYKDGDTPLILAIRNNNLPIVNYLFDNKAEINIKNSSGNTPLILAVQTNNLPIVTYLIANKADINIKNNNDSTPLLFAVENNNLQMVTYLFNNKAAINITNKDNQTPLLLAVKNNNLPIVTYLFDNKVDINIKDNDKLLTFAIKNNNLPMIKYLFDNKIIQNKVSNISLISVIEKDYLDIFTYLLAIDNDILNIKFNNDYTILMLAVDYNSIKITEYLLSIGIDPNIKNKYGDTCLTSAVIKNHQNIINLLKNKPEMSIESLNKYLVKYIMENNIIILSLLIKTIKTIDNNIFNYRNNDGYTILHLAINESKKDMVQFLLENGIDPNIKTSNDVTPLELSSNNSNYHNHSINRKINGILKVYGAKK